ncbi:ShlB/FhaC/HecB family hemolysin secretion/activation protein [Yokenella regensburgei]|uniref:ShlB/FhaC/HecB family hemolysin secretion/activation protein n=1 Tax=Yokenella regensburgei TaxID=158877 RepID=UPI001375810F|nr:ShlB/FhaC/HecB family hemolysin secretion/activation protein [Yokenella regensburgei]KAF1366708.1 hemolysin activation/secretion protein [Yokenella regensburgei]
MKKSYYIYLLFILFPSFSYANYLETQNKELMRALRYNEVQQDIKNSRENYLLQKKENNNKNIDSKEINESIKVDVRKIEVKNLNKLVNIQDIINSYENKKLTNIDIYNLIKKISERIYDEGYVTSIVTLCDEAYHDTTLCLNIKWGKIESFTEGEGKSSLRGRGTILFSYPKNHNDIVNIKDIDQAIENSNSSFQSTKIKILPSDKEGYSNIDYNIKHRYIPSVTVAINNGGNGNKNGRFKYDAIINHGGLLGFNERYTLGASARKFEKSGYVENNKFISFGFPFGYYDFGTFYSQSYSKNPLVIANVNFPYESKMKSYKFNIKNKIYRSKYNSANIKLELNFKETRNFLDNILLDSSSNNYTDFVIGFDSTFSNEYGTFYLDSSYMQGIRMNNSSSGAYVNNKGKDVSLLNGNLTYQKVFNVDEFILSWYSTGAYQYSGGQNLVGNYKSSIGDEYSIRGLNSSTALSYDTSFYMNNTLNMPLNVKGLTITPFLGFDFGLGRDSELMSTNYFYSMSSGLKFDYSIFNISLGYGKLLYLSSNNIYPGIFYFRTSVGI